MKKHKFTWIDALVIVVAVLLAVGTYIKFFVNDTTSVTQETVEFSYQLKIAGIRQCSVDSLQVGDTVYDNEGKGAVGVIRDISVTPAKSTYTKSDGTFAEAEVEDKFDVVLTVSAEGIASGNYYKVGTYNIQLNRSSTYFTKYSVWSAKIISLS